MNALPDLDQLDTYKADKSRLGRELERLVGDFPKPEGTFPPPYGVVGVGEGWWPAELLRSRFPDTLARGTTFVLAGGYGLGRLAGLLEAAREESERVVVLGFGPEAEVLVPSSPLAPYRYLRYVLEATGEGALGAEVDGALAAEAERLAPYVPSPENPAKLLAWGLLERIPLWVASDRYPMLAQALQQVFARIAKSLSIAPPPAALEFFITALEARHEQGDPLVAVVLGEDEETRLAKEVLATRVDYLEELEPPKTKGPLPEALAYWYRLAWTGYYLALLYRKDPGDHEVLARLREAAS